MFYNLVTHVLLDLFHFNIPSPLFLIMEVVFHVLDGVRRLQLQPLQLDIILVLLLLLH